MSPREQIYATFFALISGLTGGGGPLFKTSGRQLPAEDNVPIEEMPAVYVLQIDEEAHAVRMIPDRWIFSVDVYVYASTGTQTGSAPSQVLNPLVDAVVAALKGPQTGFEQTLGGIVSKCRVEGKVRYGEGVLADYAVAKIPIMITVPQ